MGALLLAGCQESPPQDDDAGAAAASADERRPAETPRRTDVPSSAVSTEEVTLAFAGDIHFEGAFDGVPDRRGSTLGPMSGALERADVAMVNLESAITRGGSPTSKELEDPAQRFWFRSPPSALDVLGRSGVDVVSLANNHGADYGAAGLRDSIRAAERSELAVVGIGRNPAAAYRPHRVSVRGVDLAFLAADASPRESTSPLWEIRRGQGPGLAAARSEGSPALIEAVRAAAAVDDVVVVYLHWGEENETCPTTLQRGLARSLARAGADVIVGSHAHQLQGAGMLGETYVSYGLGNFYWYHGRQPDTGVLQLTVTPEGVVGNELLPARIPEAGGAPRALAGGNRAAAVSSWVALRGCTALTPELNDENASGRSDTPADDLPAFTSTIRTIDARLARRMDASHDPETCPVPLSRLRHLRMSYVGFDGTVRSGEMVVHEDIAAEVVEVFGAMYDARFPLRRMQLVDAYGADDNESMAANNTSGYNCRRVAGTSTFSDHAFGRAIDINPVQNPYVFGGTVLPPQGRRFVEADRTRRGDPAPGVIRVGDVVTRSFYERGWTWGASFSEPDFQHFSTE